MKFKIQQSKNFTYTATSLDKLPKDLESKFRLMMFMKAKVMELNGLKLELITRD